MAQSDQIFRLRGEQSYSQAVRAGPLLFVSGTVSWDDSFKVIAPNDAAEQIAAIYSDIARTLAHFGLAAEHIVREKAYLTSDADIAAYRQIRGTFYREHPAGAPRVTIINGLTRADLVAEIECVCAFPDQ
ncbi:MAG: RidA family protein [Sphingopyxis sp.]|nr:RidA family protein [Sphingopyxis sp.]